MKAASGIGRRGAQETERIALVEVLGRVAGTALEAARILKVSYKTLLKKISQYGLTRDRGAARPVSDEEASAVCDACTISWSVR